MQKISNNAAAVRAIHRVRAHSRACHDLSTRKLLIDVERWIMTLMIESGETDNRAAGRLK